VPKFGYSILKWGEQGTNKFHLIQALKNSFNYINSTICFV
jgi:hypothetical protein